MSKLKSIAVLSLVLLMLVVPAIACSTSGSTTETITEAELNEQLAGQGLTADLQPGVIVFSGDIEGQSVEMKMTLSAADGGLQAQITEATVGGITVPTDFFADANAELASSIFDDEDYTVESVTITDTEITIEATRN